MYKSIWEGYGEKKLRFNYKHVSDAGLVAPDQAIYHPQENIKLNIFKPASYSISNTD